MEFRVWSSGASLRNLLNEFRNTIPRNQKLGNLLTRINVQNLIYLELDHLEFISNLHNASVRNKETVFPHSLWHTHLDMPPWVHPYPLRHIPGNTHLDISLTPLFLAGRLHWMKLIDSEHESLCRWERQEARGKWWNSNINRPKWFWYYNNKLWRWRSGWKLRSIS